MKTPEFDRALATSFRILGKKMYSVEEIRTKLIGFTYSEDIVEQVLEKLLELRYLDDYEYADLIVTSYKSRGYGKMRIREELYKRKLSSSIISEKTRDFSVDYDKILSLFDTKLRGDISDYKQNEKAKASLVRKGFSYDEINTGFSLYKQNLED